jgi:hypothetical protein
MIYIYIILAIYIVNRLIVYKLRKKRDNLNLVSNYSDKLKGKRINEVIDILNGGWILKLNKSKLKR